MTKPAKIKLQIYQGATFRKKFAWKTRAGTKPLYTYTPIDLTGCAARMHIREEIESPATLLELTTENGRITLDPLEGGIRLYISAADTELIAWESGVYDLEIVHPDATVTRLFRGPVSVSLEVTRQ